MTLEEKQKALELRKQGKGYGEIAKIIGVTKSSVTTFLRRDNLSETCPICGKKIIQKNGHRKKKSRSIFAETIAQIYNENSQHYYCDDEEEEWGY